MSLGWSRRAPVDSLVGTEAAVDFTIPLAELPRVSHELSTADGDVSGSVRFSRAQRARVADLDVSAAARSSLSALHEQPMRWPITVKRIALVSDYDAADRVPEGLEVSGRGR